MKDDAIITEVREARHRISEEHGHDLERLLKHYQHFEKQLANDGKHIFVREFFATSAGETTNKTKQ